MPPTPCILLTNDDGIHSSGLLTLAQELGSLADVTIIAPDHNWSAAGHTKTMHKPLRVQRVLLSDGTEGLATSGSPSDCVTLGLLGLMRPAPNLVVSGINLGANVGHDLTYSGTVAAAMEAAIGGVDAMAVSLDTYDADEYERSRGTVAQVVVRLADYVLHAHRSTPILLNVNVPPRPAQDILGVQITRLGRRVYRDALVERCDPRGRSYYWIGGEPPGGVPESGTDIGALDEGYVSVTPLSLDLTDHAALGALQEWDLSLPRENT